MTSSDIPSMTTEIKTLITVVTDTARKLIHTSYNYVELEILRDRNGEYEPQMIKNIRIPLKDHLHVM